MLAALSLSGKNRAYCDKACEAHLSWTHRVVTVGFRGEATFRVFSRLEFMEVILLTTLFSVAFAVLFLALFLRDRQLREFGGMEREVLMPLDDGDESRELPRREKPMVVAREEIPGETRAGFPRLP